MSNSIDEKMKDSKSYSSSISKSNNNKQNSKEDSIYQKQDSVEQRGDTLLVSKLNNSKEVLRHHSIHNNLKELNNIGKNNIFHNYQGIIFKEDFSEYLEPDIDNQDFEDIILQDKRTNQ